MPTINQLHTIDITSEKFLAACSPQELYELQLQLDSPRYQLQIQEFENEYSCSQKSID